MKYVKNAISVGVKFATQRGVLQTREGPVGYEAGDALMNGAKGEHWAIQRARFEATYKPLPPTAMGEEGQYLKMPLPVSARQVLADETIALSEARGVLQAQKGDWILTTEDGRQWVVANDIFRVTYSVLESR
ncbi:MAG: PGDYG domain-containing protein [Thiobacillaceae bacterium]